MVTGRSADGRSGLPLQPLGWHFEPQALASGALQWSVLSGQHDTRQSGGIAQRSTATLRVGLAGLRIEHLAVHGPVEAVLAPIPHVLAHAGWSGDFGLSVTRWDCPLYGPCSGELTLLWRGARSTLLPGQPFGDYTLHLSADRGDLRYRIHTLAGRVVVEGGGKAGRGLAPDFSASLKGDPTLLDRLPALAGGIVRPTAEAGRFDVSWPAR
jgi:general secretion pathway protein N